MRCLLIVLISLLSQATICFASSPQLFFSDLTDGPVAGWNESSSKGAAVSIWGNNFGSSRGTSYVTVGGVNLTQASDYAEWGATTNPITARGLQRITFWLNSSMSLGNTTITVTTAAGISQSIPFYTRNTGHIYFVSPSGDDTHTGLNDTTQSFRHPYKAKQIMQAGDVAYVRTGTYTGYEYEGSHKGLLVFGPPTYNNGSANNSISIVSYPGEVATLGDGTTEFAYWQTDYGSNHAVDYWTIGKFKVNTNDHCFSWLSTVNSKYNNYFRLIGNDLTSHITALTQGHLISMFSNFHNLKVLGNYGHDIGVDDNGDFVYKTLFLYFCGGGVSNNVEIAWNHTFKCGKPIQVFGHWDTDRVDNLNIHDNFFDTSMPGSGAFVVGGGDPQNGGEQYTFIQNAKIYNNIFTNIGADFRIEGTQNGYGGNYEVYNNTFYGVGGTGPVLHIVNPNSFKFYNNIIYLTNASGYYDDSNAGYPSAPPTNIEEGKNNLWFGGSTKPSWSNQDVDGIDPFFTDQSTNDFHLQSTSPARNAGVTIPLVTHDFDGLTRPQGSAYDIGAYEYVEVGEQTAFNCGSVPLIQIH